MAVVDRVELLSQIEGEARDLRKLERFDGGLCSLLNLRCRENQIPEIILPKFLREGRGALRFHFIVEFLLAKPAKDIGGAHQGVLQIWARVPFESECFREVEGNDAVGRGLDHEETQSRQGDGVRPAVQLFGRQRVVASLYFLATLGLELIDQVIGLDSDSLAARHLETLAVS